MIDYRAAIHRFGIEPRGVVHIGGYIGEENLLYRDIGFKNRLFVEAQSDTFEILSHNLEGSGAFCEHCAISDTNGQVRLNVCNNGQSSSILKLKRHQDIYPSILNTSAETVDSVKLDDLLCREKYKNMEFNFINVDIQGAELLALAGATNTLKRIDLINAEINFDELYENAPHVRHLDAFLSAFDFTRVDTFLAHRTWGDALFVKNAYTKA